MKKYWLRFGLSFAAIYTFLALAYIIYVPLMESDPAGQGLAMIPLAIAGIPSTLIAEFIGNLLPSFGSNIYIVGIFILVLSLPQYFLFGALIGWFYQIGKLGWNRNSLKKFSGVVVLILLLLFIMYVVRLNNQNERQVNISIEQKCQESLRAQYPACIDNTEECNRKILERNNALNQCMNAGGYGR
jgi:uncharacterized membrane protein